MREKWFMTRLRAALLILAAAAACTAGGCQYDPFADSAISHWMSGRSAMDRKDYDAALAELGKAVQANPNLSLAHASIGDIHRARGDYDQAIAAYQQATRSDPYAFAPQYNLGLTYSLMARAAKTAAAIAASVRNACDAYLRAVTLRPDDFDANLNLSACYYEIGQYDLAEQYCKSAIEVDPLNPNGHSNLGTIYLAQSGSADAAAREAKLYHAIRAYKESLEIDIHQSELLLNLAETYAKLSRLKDAMNVPAVGADGFLPVPPEEVPRGADLVHQGSGAQAGQRPRPPWAGHCVHDAVPHRRPELRPPRQGAAVLASLVGIGRQPTRPAGAGAEVHPQGAGRAETVTTDVISNS
jgi:tetratricopeptide (TPR) repeat protein